MEVRRGGVCDSHGYIGEVQAGDRDGFFDHASFDDAGSVCDEEGLVHGARGTTLGVVVCAPSTGIEG